MEPDIDARGLKCPEPVLRARKMLAEGAGAFSILVDNPTARDNVGRFARSSGCAVELEDSEGCFLLRITPHGVPVSKTVEDESDDLCGDTCPGAGAVLLITSDDIGRGEGELGAALMKTFLFTCSESDLLPSAAVLMNSGVKLATEDDQAVENLRKLEERGCDVLVCGTCLDYYGLAGRLRAGRVSNMYEIQSLLVGAPRVVSL